MFKTYTPRYSYVTYSKQPYIQTFGRPVGNVQLPYQRVNRTIIRTT